VAPSAYHGRPWLTVVGEPAEAAELAGTALASSDGGRCAGVSLPPGAAEQLAGLQVRRSQAWTWWWLAAPDRSPGPGPAGVRVGPLAADDPRLPALLDQSSSVYLRPGDPRVRSWHGAAAGQELLGCLAVEQHKPGVPHLASVVVARSARRHGVARTLCGAVCGQLLRQGAPTVTLAMMTANSAAAELYRGLGFAPGPSFVSGTLVSGGPPQPTSGDRR
jgi:ribosomal protein S18 acetylase RimI-like enzyme